jgi:hypothetical protein
MQRNRPKAVAYDTQRMERDMAERGWLPTDLARAARTSDMTVGRFLNGVHQTERTAWKLATAMGYTVRRYLLPSRKERVAS